MRYVPADLIRKKRFGGELSRDEIQFFIQKYITEEIPDYQISALLMAICFQGMSDAETAHYTEVLRDSGSQLDFTKFHPFVVDKHSTGGVGDKTSLILAPLVAAAGLKVPMIAGRGLGHTGGTLDKLESIPGFNVHLSFQQFQQYIDNYGYCIMGQTEDLCPADKKLYALRDVTGTVDSLPLICGSIMSKKLAEGLKALVLDVKFGSGAFMKTEQQAVELAQLLQATGTHHGLDVHALITNMEEPLGAFVGNALEVHECIEIMQGQQRIHSGIDFYSDTKELTLLLAGEMIYAGAKASSPEQGYKIAKKILESGEAFENFKKMIQFQQGDLSQFKILQNSNEDIVASQDGYIHSMDVEAIGMASLLLGAGRLKSSDRINPNVGIEMKVKIGSSVKKGQPLCSIYCENNLPISTTVTEKLCQAFEVKQSPNVKRLRLVSQVLRKQKEEI